MTPRKQRLAGDVGDVLGVVGKDNPLKKPGIDHAAFDTYEDPSGATYSEPSALSHQAHDIVSEASGGRQSRMRAFTPGEMGYGDGGGYVNPMTNPGVTNVDPVEANIHVQAHELAHDQLMGPAGRAEVERLKKGGPWTVDPKSVPKGPARLRYVAETTGLARMDEEARAQGVARAVTDEMGLGNVARGFRNDPTGLLPARKADGSIDSLAYPRDIGLNGIRQYELVEGADFEGRPLGIGIDPRFSEAEREEAYGIIDNLDDRMGRSWRAGQAAIKNRGRCCHLGSSYRNRPDGLVPELSLGFCASGINCVQLRPALKS